MSIVLTQSIAYNEDGEVVYDITKKPFKANGGGFVISYTEKMCDFLSKVRAGSIVRTFLYIAHHQSYGTDGVQFGYRCSHSHLARVLKLDRSTLWEALKYLQENFLLNVFRVDGQVEFMVNPNYVTIGSDKKARVREWNRRWELFWKKDKKKD